MSLAGDAPAPRPYSIWYGRDEPPGQLLELRAGPLTVQLDRADLRYLRLGDVELVRRLYAAVRDPNWNTLPALLSNRKVDAAHDHFMVSFTGHHQKGEIDYTWRGTITGAPDGTITYAMDGLAGREFRYNKIGLNIHHPMREAAGRPYTATTPAGPLGGTLPDTIGPQLIVDGIDVPLFTPFSRLTIDHDGSPITFDFQGALAEMEDQRNWSDASFKTYMPQQIKGFPYSAQAAQRFQHTITISLSGTPTPRRRRPAQPAAPAVTVVEIGEPLGWALPRVGLGMASHGGDLTAGEANLLRLLHLDHLRADLRLVDPAYPREVARARRAAQELRCGLELAVFLADAAEAELAGLAEVLRGVSVPVRRVLAFHQGEEATAGRWVELARRRLAPVLPGVPFAGGTNANFCELNRARLEVDMMDAVVYSVNPQIHAFDELSLAEAVEAQAEQVRSARALSGGLPIVVSPITLKPRFNAVATDPDLAPASGGLPWEVDVRQTSLFGSAWTVGSLKYLAESGARSVTYYETTGWRGLMETAAGSPMPDLFPSRPGMVFPLYHVFADLGAWRGGQVVRAATSDPLTITALAVQHDEALHLVVANLTARPRQVTLMPVPGESVAVRSLDQTTAGAAIFQPHEFRARQTTLDVRQGRLLLELAPYATARIDTGGRS